MQSGERSVSVLSVFSSNDCASIENDYKLLVYTREDENVADRASGRGGMPDGRMPGGGGQRNTRRLTDRFEAKAPGRDFGLRRAFGGGPLWEMWIGYDDEVYGQSDCHRRRCRRYDGGCGGSGERRTSMPDRKE